LVDSVNQFAKISFCFDNKLLETHMNTAIQPPWELLFLIFNGVAFCAWIALIFFPRWPVLRKMIAGGVLTGLCFVYSGLALAFFARSEGGGFATLPQVMKLFSYEPLVLAGWVHYLAFDLFVGLWIAKRADHHGIHRCIQGIVLFCTFMFGPFGLALYLSIERIFTSTWMHTRAKNKDEQAYLVLASTAMATAALLVMTLIAYTVDNRLINEINIWIKPIKFNASMLVYLLTLGWALTLMNDELRRTDFVKRSIWLGSISGLFEIFYIAIQAARGRASHFNDGTKIELVLYGIMGIGATAMVVSAFLIGMAVWKNRKATHRVGERFGMFLGLTVGSVATLITAMVLASGAIDGPGHWVGGIKTDNAGLWPFGWSSTGGDLRVPHFFATHLMQAVPLVGIFADRLRITSKQILVIGSAICGVAVIVGTFVQAINGYSFAVIFR
jgi:Domain of unknown function (DUF4281)